jgi:hypothetical protein
LSPALRQLAPLVVPDANQSDITKPVKPYSPAIRHGAVICAQAATVYAIVSGHNHIRLAHQRPRRPVDFAQGPLAHPSCSW